MSVAYSACIMPPVIKQMISFYYRTVPFSDNVQYLMQIFHSDFIGEFLGYGKNPEIFRKTLSLSVYGKCLVWLIWKLASYAH